MIRRVMSAATVGLCVGSLVLGPAAVTPWGAPAAVAIPDGAVTPATYAPITPTRVFDGRLAAEGDGTTVDVTGLLPAAADGTTFAAVLNVTASDAESPGYASAWGGGARPLGAVVAFAAGRKASASSLVEVHDAQLHLWASTSTRLAVDVVGFTVQKPGAVTGIRSITTARVADSRESLGFIDKLGAGQSADIDVSAAFGDVDPSRVAAVMVTLTAVDAEGPGYLTAHAYGTPRPASSNVNYVAETAAANSAMVRVRDGTITVYSMETTHVVVDVTAFVVTDDTPSPEQPATGYRVITHEPVRAYDSRDGGVTGPPPFLTRRVNIAAPLGVDPAAVKAAFVNITVDNTHASGFVTVDDHVPPGAHTPLLSFEPGHVTSHATMAAVSDGSIDVYTEGGANVVVDVFALALDGDLSNGLPERPTDAGGAAYRTCDDATADGRGPFTEGDIGYREDLDPDGDGIACDNPTSPVE